MNRFYKLKNILLVAIFIFTADHITKWLIVKNIPLGGEINVIPNIFEIVHGRNSGAAFGFLSGWDSPARNWFFYIIGVAALFFLYHYAKSLAKDDKLSLFALGLITGGAMGNIFDRILRGNVVDFLSFHYHHKIWKIDLFGMRAIIPLDWPAFNVADSAISIAVCLLIIQNIRQGLKHDNRTNESKTVK